MRSTLTDLIALTIYKKAKKAQQMLYKLIEECVSFELME